MFGQGSNVQIIERRAVSQVSTEVHREREYAFFEKGIIVVALIFALLNAGNTGVGDAVTSRLATVYSLTKYGTWAIDRPAEEPPIKFEQRTIDKVRVNGHLISSKPPVLPLIMTLEYYLLKNGVGWSLDDEKQTTRIIRFMSFTLIGLSYGAALLFFAKTLGLFVSDPFIRSILLFSLAFCTQLWGYSYHINNHMPATAALMVSLYCGLSLAMNRVNPDKWRFFLFGFAAGLVPALDMPVAVFAAFAGVYLLWKHPSKTLTWGLLGALIPVAIHVVCMWQSTGSILPVQTRNDVYLYEASYWRSPLFVDALNEPKTLYGFHMTFGRSGIFLLFPILVLGLMAAGRALIKPNSLYRGPILSGTVAFLILTAYYIMKTNNYGGEAYGFRWYIGAMPVLLLMSGPLLATVRARWQWILITVMVGISFFSGFECAKSPWGANNQWTTRLVLGPSWGPIDR